MKTYIAVVYTPSGEFDSEQPVTLSRVQFDNESFDSACTALSCELVQVNTTMLDGHLIDIFSDEEAAFKDGPSLGFQINDDEGRQWLIPGPIAISGNLYQDCPFDPEKLTGLFAQGIISPVWLESQT